jgi:hypothetical protein
VSLLLEENATVSVVNENEFQAFSDEVTNALDHFINRNEIIDTDSVEFGIDYDNRITIDNIQLQDDMLCDELRDILLDKFQEAFGKIKTE